MDLVLGEGAYSGPGWWILFWFRVKGPTLALDDGAVLALCNRSSSTLGDGASPALSNATDLPSVMELP